MKCPVDKIDMIVVEHKRIELDYCLQCSGVWFDAGELDLLVEALTSDGECISQGGLLTPDKAAVTEARHKCPVCNQKMDKVWLGKEPKVLVDSCPRGDGFWFDGGELHQVLSQIGPADKTCSKEILFFLGDAFQANHKPD